MEETANKLNAANSNANFNKGRLSKWENGNDEPRLSSLKQVADLFDVSIDYFFDNDGSETINQNKTAKTIAAHVDEDTPEEERQQIINFIENLKKARK